ncbi:MAG: hypothetical protein NZZ41_06820, partial [Candidatus Dojkabacteria bacterium]|nr:hypothetical protein [Candidatus Dojkabacteria bacterium]
RKFKDKLTVPNTVSFIINTNNYSALKLSPDDRRFFMPDIVNKKESKEYYKVLYKYTNDPIVGEAFYMHCKEIVNNNPNFDEFDRPITKKFIDNIVDSVPSTYKFIRETYIMNGLGIDMKFKDLYTDYIEFCANHSANHSMKALNKQAFKNELIKIGINYIPNSNKRHCHHNQNWVENTHKQLVEIFLKNNLMTEEDLGDMEYIQESNQNENNSENNKFEKYYKNNEIKNQSIFIYDNQEENEKQEQKNISRQNSEEDKDNDECNKEDNDECNKEDNDECNKEDNDECNEEDNEEEIEIPAAKKIRKKEILTKNEFNNKLKFKKNREFVIKFNNSD